MWKWVVVAVLAGCGGGGERPDQGDDVPGSHTCDYPPSLCRPPGAYSSLCGNNALDTCSMPTMPGHCTLIAGQREACDGTATASCASLGFYDGEVTCDRCTLLDTTTCRACAGTVDACVTRPGFLLENGALAVNGTRIAALAGNRMAIFEGTTFITETAIAGTDIIAVPAGFLVAERQPPALRPVGTDGTLGALQPLPTSVTSAKLVIGPNNRVLVAWREQTAVSANVVITIADLAGTIIVPQTVVFPASQFDTSVATDGTQFLLANDGRLARIAPDGTFTVTSGFPTGAADVVWDGTNGWYVAHRSSVQRFTADGVVADAAIPAPDVIAGTAGTNVLLALEHTASELFIEGRSAAGTTAKRLVGRGGMVSALRLFGAQVVVGWNAGSMRLALVPAP